MRPDEAVDTLASGLRDRLLAHGLDRHAALLTSLDDVEPPTTRADGPPVHRSVLRSVLRWWDPALARARAETMGEIADAVAELAPSLSWTRTAGHVADPPNAGFLDGYAHATLAASPDDGPFFGVVLGLLLLGAGVDYPPHHHPADEVYLPLTPARWIHGLDEDHRPEPAGVPIHHRPWQPHGMRTGDAPLLAIYLWSGDVATPSRFC